MFTTWDGWQLTEEEPFWNVADGARAGKDVFWNCSAVCNRSGVDWLRRHFSARGLRLHPIIFDGRAEKLWKPWHIDCEFTMVRPGLLILNPEDPILNGEEIYEMFRRNDWEIVQAASPSHEYDVDVSLICHGTEGGMYGKSWISMNTFALGPNTICVEAHETAYMEQLNKMGIEVVPVPYEHVVPYGGSLHYLGHLPGKQP